MGVAIGHGHTPRGYPMDHTPVAMSSRAGHRGGAMAHGLDSMPTCVYCPAPRYTLHTCCQMVRLHYGGRADGSGHGRASLGLQLHLGCGYLLLEGSGLVGHTHSAHAVNAIGTPAPRAGDEGCVLSLWEGGSWRWRRFACPWVGARVSAGQYDGQMATNRFPTYCTDCGEKKPAGHGQVGKVAGRWVVSHAPSRGPLSRAQFSDEDTGSDDGYDALKDGIRERWG